MWFIRKNPKGENKYKNTRTEVDGIKFQSIAEAKRYIELKKLESKGLIKDLVLQPRFPLIVSGAKVCTYVADFQYAIVADNEIVLEDVKGAITDSFKFKARLYSVLHPELPLTIIKSISGKLSKRSKRKRPVTRESFLKLFLCSDRKYCCKRCGAPLGCSCQIWP